MPMLEQFLAYSRLIKPNASPVRLDGLIYREFLTVSARQKKKKTKKTWPPKEESELLRLGLIVTS